MAAITNTAFSRPKWRSIVILTLAFWLSGSLILDLLIMPSLYAAGMMTSPGFASAGYTMFWLFNHLEVLCAALVVTGVLVLKNIPGVPTSRWSVPLAVGLLTIVLIYTYALTPALSALGLQLDLFTATLTLPTTMGQMHSGYWLLEAVKLIAGGTLLGIQFKSVEA